MNFFVAIEDIIDDCVSVENEVYDCNRSVLWGTADLWAARAFCGKGRLPTKDELLTIYNNKSKINSLSTAAGGQNLAMAWYWSSTVNFDTASETDDHVGFNGYYTVNMADGRHGWVYGQEWYSARPVLVEGNF